MLPHPLGVRSGLGGLPSALLQSDAGAQVQASVRQAAAQATGPAATSYQQAQQTIQSFSSAGAAGQAADGIATVASGGTPSNEQIEGAFTVAATVGAVALGATVTVAAAAIAPLAAVVFGAGFAIGSLIQKVLGITNQGPIACSGDDKAVYGSAPGQRDWRTYAGVYGPASAQHAPAQDGLDGLDPRCYWQPYTTGAFETWARPILIRTVELWMNCKPVLPDNTATSFMTGLLQTWNDQFPNALTRTIFAPGQGNTALDAEIVKLNNTTFTTNDRPALFWQVCAWQGDPIQVLIAAVGQEKQSAVSFTVAEPPAAVASQAAPSTITPGHVAVGIAVVGGAALLGASVYALVKGKTLLAVGHGALAAAKGWFP
jgi:hypothetical protein